MKCPECEGSMKVLRTDDRGEVIFRRRKCRVCGHNMRSTETFGNNDSEKESISGTNLTALDISVAGLLKILHMHEGNRLRTLIATIKSMEGKTNKSHPTEELNNVG